MLRASELRASRQGRRGGPSFDPDAAAYIAAVEAADGQALEPAIRTAYDAFVAITGPGGEVVAPPEPEPGAQVWSTTGIYQKPATVTGAAGTPGAGRTWTLQTASETAEAGREPWQAYMWAVWAEEP